MAAAANTPTPIATPAAVLPAERTPQDVAALLRRPFAPHVIKSRKIAGRDVEYISIDDVIARLNKAALEWNWQVTDVRILTMPLTRKAGITDVPVAQVIGELEIPGLGKRQGIGTAPCEGTEDATKAAASDALKKASSLFSVPTGGR